MAEKYICVHGHFYQPPRENAWLETIEEQDSAHPFHDWNDRINFECYAPNTAARILDKDSYIKNITNNYTKISFNFGPTLLSWMEKTDPDSYKAIIEADKISQENCGGHGNAIAQAYSHMILPLANQKDKETQIIWGIKDFEYRFGRKPEGMWLAETAADLASLETLAEFGIKYTILAPNQAKAFRKMGDHDWTYLTSFGVDPRRPYLCKLPSGKSIALFFYDGDIAKDVAFKGLLNSGKSFANRFMEGFGNQDQGEAQLVHIATDGESYGHHHSNGEMALADCLNSIEQQQLATITNYGEYLEKFPPTHEAQIHDNSSWSCVHGIERWRSNCGCNSGGRPTWNQEWRRPLRALLDWLRDTLSPLFLLEAGKLVQSPWETRNDYIAVLLNRTEESIEHFIEKNAKRKLNKEEVTHLLRLLEMQRNAILMFTSCAWFFDEVSGIETNQVLQYALRAIHYAKSTTGLDLHPEFEERLEKIPSNVYENGATSYREVVLPSSIDLERVAMHYATATLFRDHDPEGLPLFNYKAKNKYFERIKAGNQIMVIGRTSVFSKITFSEELFSFAVLYLGQQNMIGNISVKMPESKFQQMSQELTTAFKDTNLGKVIGLMQEWFGSEKFSIWHLFQDEKRKILKEITQNSLQKVEGNFRDIYNHNYQLMTGMLNSNIPIPKAYENAVEHVINLDLRRFFEKGYLDVRELYRLAKEFEKWGVSITNFPSLKLEIGERLFYEIKKMEFQDIPLDQLNTLVTTLEILEEMKLNLAIWKGQNFYFYLLKMYKGGKRKFPAQEWEQAFIKLGKLLKVKA